ncbi:hypothetical protein EDB19DRAFT_1825904 [Suillus lakei]|nr:hypothetical protein EDB19DRAFT_1825904 [Suillus lakei]
MSALDFITCGEPEGLKLKRELVLASINSSENQENTRASEGLQEPHVNNAPKDVHSESRFPHTWLKSASGTIYDTYNKAKAACALREGVLDFIKHGNGQPRPASSKLYPPSSSSDINGVSANKRPPLRLQAFYESLPGPFPESFESKDTNGFSAPGYINTLVQNAHRILHTSSIPGSPNAPMQKWLDVSKLCSHDAEDYMHAIGKVLSHGKEKDAFGCIMTRHLTTDPTPDQTRTWTVSNDYLNKADAKKKVKLEGEPTSGNKKENGSGIYTHIVPESAIIRARPSSSQMGYVSALSARTSGDESGSGSAYLLPRGPFDASLNPTPPAPDWRSMPPHSFYSQQGGYGYPLSVQSFAGASGSHTGFGL